jgi:hypothetical protein
VTKVLKWVIAVVMFVATPVTAEELSEYHQHFADTIGTAHGIEAYRSHAALQADITVTFGGKVMLKGVMTFDTPVGKSHIKTEDGTVMVFDGKDAWVAPVDASVPPGMSRFHLLTWPYFVAAPFKLADPGAQIDDAGNKPLDAHRILPAGKLTFGAGIGDTPDDWYMVYMDRDTERLAALAYIVTYGKTTGDAEKEPHVAIYEAYETVDGVFLPTNMSMWNWEPATGRVGKQLGSIELSNYHFVEPDDSTFTKPSGARVDAPPPSGNEG